MREERREERLRGEDAYIFSMHIERREIEIEVYNMHIYSAIKK